jgi:hypothetical protein
MYSPIGFAVSNTSTKKTIICSQPFDVIRTSPDAAMQTPDRPASRPLKIEEEYSQAWSFPPFSESQP